MKVAQGADYKSPRSIRVKQMSLQVLLAGLHHLRNFIPSQRAFQYVCHPMSPLGPMRAVQGLFNICLDVFAHCSFEFVCLSFALLVLLGVLFALNF